jgi:lysozyme
MGIDVSHFQGQVDWQAVHDAGNSFAFAKATDGISMVDPTFQTNIAGMKAAQIFAGAYHFFHADVDPVAQANHFLATVDGLNLELPLCLDLEDQAGLARVGQSAMVANVTSFVSTVEAATSGRKMIIYGSVEYLSMLNGDFAGHPLWLAQ